MSVSTKRRCLAVLLAAGEGKRMRSATPKVLHKVAGRSMLAHALTALAGAGAESIAVVVGPGAGDVAAEALRIAPQAEIFTQTERLGTAHAVLAARTALARGYDDILVAFADTPLVTAETFAALRAGLAGGAAVTVLAFEPENPAGYGRVLLGPDGGPDAIREEKDASPAEKAIRLSNAGVMALDGHIALALLDAIEPNNAQKEYYLTDAVALARSRGARTAHRVAPEAEVMGVNDRVQLAACEARAQAAARRTAMLGGATLQAPETVFIAAGAKIGQDVTIEPNVVIGPGCEIADGATIHAFSHLEGAYVGPGANVGPFARLRPGARLEKKAKVGNFVEIKKSHIGAGAKVSHLTYIGDATVGAEANIGAGVVTCNYDGFDKFQTVIGDNAFVGTNSSLVAPVKIGEGAFVGSGSVITRDVAPDALALGRGQQVEKPGWAKAFRAKKTKKKGD
ncbi:MAG: bifunctional UDP-N-acetylglucosamine diphosphorylase/glucosamine-1-phosphate N-acetyltransferase GlmU [Hyphomicrobiales bacterium]|nr:bifunctional UDP-N-acetylglucosamine diphosphorylase/glucosamine-1-phosphate N-acetyltransferase GlmU [Hyphomicrobiales bacterium]